jgi:hypothetical protein
MGSTPGDGPFNKPVPTRWGDFRIEDTLKRQASVDPPKRNDVVVIDNLELR